MQDTTRKYLIGLLLFLAAGTLVGVFYGQAVTGLLVTSLIALAWHVRYLVAFMRGLQSDVFTLFRMGEGVWQQIYSQFSFERERAERAKRRYRQLLKEIRRSTDAMPDGAVILDANNEIVICNRAAKKLAGLKPKKDRGQRIDNILRNPELIGLLRSGEYSRSIEIVSPVDDEIWLNCRVVPYGANQKLLFLRDITERIRLTRMRRDFVANASHELRSPLTVISGYLETFAGDERAPGEWVQPLRQMQAQARRMNRVVAELLELSRVESGGPARDNENVDVGSLLDLAKKAYYRQGETAEIEVAAESSARLRGRTGEIESVISNLVSNAIRHTPAHGKIRLTWRSEKKGAKLAVEDNGEGIEPEHLPRLTERFFRVDTGRARDEGGVGLGLAIVKHILNRHDGRLEIESVRGKGSRFVCRFPPERVVVAPPTPLTTENTGVDRA